MFESLHSLFSMSSPKRYVINIDDAGSKLHLNPKYYDDMWCKLDQEKRLGFGGRREVTREEAIAYRSGKKSLIFNARAIYPIVVPTTAVPPTMAVILKRGLARLPSP